VVSSRRAHRNQAATKASESNTDFTLIDDLFEKPLISSSPATHAGVQPKQFQLQDDIEQRGVPEQKLILPKRTSLGPWTQPDQQQHHQKQQQPTATRTATVGRAAAAAAALRRRLSSVGSAPTPSLDISAFSSMAGMASSSWSTNSSSRRQNKVSRTPDMLGSSSDSSRSGNFPVNPWVRQQGRRQQPPAGAATVRELQQQQQHWERSWQEEAAEEEREEQQQMTPDNSLQLPDRAAPPFGRTMQQQQQQQQQELQLGQEQSHRHTNGLQQTPVWMQQQIIKQRVDRQLEAALEAAVAAPPGNVGHSVSSSKLFGASGLLMKGPELQQLLDSTEKQQQQQHSGDIVRSSRKVRQQPQQVKQQQAHPGTHQEQQQQQPPIAGNIGATPLLVIGGQAAGEAVVWSSEPAVLSPSVPMPSMSAAGAAGAHVVQPLKSAVPPQQQQQQQHQQHKVLSGSTAAASAGRSARPAARSGQRHARYRRGLAGPQVPGLQQQQQPQVIGLLPAVADGHSPAHSDGSTGSSLQQRQQQEQRLLPCEQLSIDNWQQQAQLLAPELFDAAWHSSLYAFMLDMWRIVLTADATELLVGASNNLQPVGDSRAVSSTVTSTTSTATGSSSSSSSITATMTHNTAGSGGGNSRSVGGGANSRIAPPSSSTATAQSLTAAAVRDWAVACLQNPRRYIWGSAVLALIDSLADDEAARCDMAVKVVPVQLLQQLAVQAAEVLDDGVHCALTAAVDAVQQQQVCNSSSNHHCASSHLSSGLPEAVAAGPEDVASALLELQQLQGVYPAADWSLLAHVAQAHGVWTS
jgi:hypothetical protein